MTNAPDDPGSSSDHRASSGDCSPSNPIYYFGYGPIVNPIVRRRRGVKTMKEQGAVLPEYRLTFAYGGVVNAIKQRGYEVQGVLMAFETQEDWARFQEFDAGYNLDQVQVFPFDNPEEPTTAYTFLQDREYSDGDKADRPLETLPQERYLKLIASGMRAYQIDEEYIEDHILSIPYVPKTKPEDFKQFPQTRPVLPRISFLKYQERLCGNAGPADIYFVVGIKVIRVDPHDPSNPCSRWLRERAHGQPDVTLTLHRTVVDLDLPMVDDPQDLTPLHIAWAENHFVEYLEQGGMSATAIFLLLSDRDELEGGPPSLLASFLACCGCRKGNGHSADETPASASITNRSNSSNNSTQTNTGTAGAAAGGGNSGSSSSGNRRVIMRIGSSSSRMTRRNSNRPRSSVESNEDGLLDPSDRTSGAVSISMELMRRAMPDDAGDTTDDDDSSVEG